MFNQHDFIFSNRLSWRLKRHAAFWLLWWIYNLLTQFFPGFWFPGWQMKGNMGNVEKIGYLRFIEFSLIENFIGGLTNQFFFVYVVLYFLLPRYFYKGKWLSMTIGLLVLFFITTVFANYLQVLHYRALLAAFGLPAINSQLFSTFAHKVSRLLVTLPTVTALAVGITLLKRWWLKQHETELLAREKVNAELQLLKARIHPHFLFNSLNNIYSFSLEESPKTPEMIQKLSGLLHYMVYECMQPEVPLEKELKMLHDYLSLENIRYGERLALNVQISGSAGNKMIAPLLLIPFVENSFKHGSSKMITDPEISLAIRFTDDTLYFKLVNGKPADAETSTANANHGLGLANVKKRLALLYPGRYQLEITNTATTYTVWLKISMTTPAAFTVETVVKKQKLVYERT